MSSFQIKTDFHARVRSWMKRSKPKNQAHAGTEEAKAKNSYDSSNQLVASGIAENLCKGRRLIRLKDIIQSTDGWGIRAHHFLDKVLPKGAERVEVQAEYRPRLHVGTFNIMRDLTGITHGTPIWQDIYIYFTISSSLDRKLRYNYYYTLEPEANRAKRSFKIEENICDQHHMSKRKRRLHQKKRIEPWVIYKQEFAVRPSFQHLSGIVDLRYERFKKEYYQQATFRELEGVSQPDRIIPREHHLEDEESRSKYVSPIELHVGQEEAQTEGEYPSELTTGEEEPELDWISPSGLNLVVGRYDQMWHIGMVI